MPPPPPVSTSTPASTRVSPAGSGRPLFKKPPRVSSTIPDSPALYAVSPATTLRNIKDEVTPVHNQKRFSMESDASFNFPPCGESFFESDAPLPSTLESYKSGGAKSSPVSTPGQGFRSAISPGANVNKDRLFSFKPAASVSNPATKNSFSTPLDFGEFSMPGDLDMDEFSDIPNGQSNFDFKYSITTSNTPANNQPTRLARDQEMPSFNIDSFDSEFAEESTSGSNTPLNVTGTQFIQNAATQAFDMSTVDSPNLGKITNKICLCLYSCNIPR